MSACANYSVMLQLYLDDELSGSDQQDLQLHLETCAACKLEMEELSTLSQQLRRARPRIAAPAALRELILKEAERRGQETEGTPGETQDSARQARKPSRLLSFPKASWSPMAIVAMLCLVAAASLLIPHLRREANAESFIDTAIVAHRDLTDASMPLDVRSDSPGAVASWLSRRVSFPFRMPNAGIASDATARYVLTGGRLLTFGGDRAALLAFQTPNDTISVLISSEKKAAASGGKITHSGDITFHSRDKNDLHIVTWENKELVYALISSNKKARAYTCSSCHVGAQPGGSAMLNDSALLVPGGMPSRHVLGVQ